MNEWASFLFIIFAPSLRATKGKKNHGQEIFFLLELLLLLRFGGQSYVAPKKAILAARRVAATKTRVRNREGEEEARSDQIEDCIAPKLGCRLDGAHIDDPAVSSVVADGEECVPVLIALFQHRCWTD